MRVFLLLAAVLAAGNATAGTRLLGIQLNPLNAMVSADLDGDHCADIATARVGARNAGGYLHEISVRLSSTELSTFSVRTRRLAHRLTVRDLDGDLDRDLVLESFDREPLAVFLNDGEGHFIPANIEDFRSVLRRPSSLSLEAGSSSLERWSEIWEGPSTPVAKTRYRHILSCSPLASVDRPQILRTHTCHVSGRGPPRP